jgi:sugar phosphate permease
MRSRYGLTLPQIGGLLAAPSIGSIATLYSWGVAADRFGERAVLALGLCSASACMAAAAFATSFTGLALLLLAAGAMGASANSASGRAVLQWFDADQRGFALGVRQTAVPIGGAWVALVLPRLVSGTNPRTAIVLLAVGCLAGGLFGLAVLRDAPEPVVSVKREITTPVRERSMWLLSGGSALIVAPQVCLIGFLVVFLHSQRHLTTSSAGFVLAAVNILGIGTRIGAGRWSDLAGNRLGPLRRIAIGSALLVGCCAALLSSPLLALLPLLVLMGCVTISWNGLSFAAAAETAGHSRSGAAIGLQQTMLAISSSALPIAFGGLIAATSWRTGYAAVALFPIAGWWLIRRIRT